MKKKSYVLYVIVVILLIASTIMVYTKGFNIGVYYAEGKSIRITTVNSIDMKEIKQIVSEIWKDQPFHLSKVELFDNSFAIKVFDYTDEDIETLVSKLNEKYSESLTKDSVVIEDVANVRVRHLLEPYAIPTMISLLLILMFYSIRYRGTKEMIGLIKVLILVSVLGISAYAICRIPIDISFCSIAFSTYILTIVFYSTYSELKLRGMINSKKETKIVE